MGKVEDKNGYRSRHSDDLELIEITSPAEFVTHAAEAPE